MFQTKKQVKTSEKELTKMEISNLPDEEFKAMAIKMLTELRRSTDWHSEYFNKETENKSKYQIEVITNLKNTREGFNSRLDEVEEWNQRAGRQNNATHPIRAAIFFFQFLKSEDNLRDLWDVIR